MITRYVEAVHCRQNRQLFLQFTSKSNSVGVLTAIHLMLRHSAVGGGELGYENNF